MMDVTTSVGQAARQDDPKSPEPERRPRVKLLRIDLAKCDQGRQSCAHECETECVRRVFKLDDPALAALRILVREDGTGAAVLCDQCGDCVVVCPADALRRNKLGVVMIDKKACVGCYTCVGFCDQGIFMRNPASLVPHKCTSCGICVKACPCGALEIVEVPEPPYRII